MSVSVWQGQLVDIVRSILTTATVTRVSMVLSARMVYRGSCVTVLKEQVEETAVIILMNAPAAHVRMEQFARMDSGRMSVIVLQAIMEVSVNINTSGHPPCVTPPPASMEGNAAREGTPSLVSAPQTSLACSVKTQY